MSEVLDVSAETELRDLEDESRDNGARPDITRRAQTAGYETVEGGEGDEREHERDRIRGEVAERPGAIGHNADGAKPGAPGALDAPEGRRAGRRHKQHGR